MDGTDKAFYKLTGGGTITLDLNGNTLTMNKIGQMYQTTGGSQATDNPDTGDHSALTLWITMLALSGTLGVSAVLSALAAKRRNSAR